MAQITRGLRSVLSVPAAYNTFQNILGARRVRKELCDAYICARPGDIMVDVGCGPADILEFIDPAVIYHGYDLSQAYIDAALRQYGHRGSFHCEDITLIPDGVLPPCDVAIAIGLLHHLDDDGAERLLSCLHGRMRNGARLVTFDPAYWPGQSRFGRFMISKDRGQNVRWGESYRELAMRVFKQVKVVRRDDLLNIPYSHAILECTK
jgi:SAM-dependent methyltransferase